MAVNLSPVYGVGGQLFDNNGNPLAGGKIYTYLAGTTTNAATYTNASGSIAHSNPIVLDGAGRVPSGEIWLTDGISYKFVVEDSASALIGTYDNLVGINSNFVNFLTEQEIQTATAGQTVFTLTTIEYQPGTNNLSVFVDGVNQYGPGASYSYVETSSTVVTFTSGLHVGAEVKFTTAQTLSSGTTDASLVTYDPPFTGSVVTNVEDKLAQYVSVKDFGAIADGVTDQTQYLNSAIEALAPDGGEIIIPFNVMITLDDIVFPDNPSYTGSGAWTNGSRGYYNISFEGSTGGDSVFIARTLSYGYQGDGYWSGHRISGGHNPTLFLESKLIPINTALVTGYQARNGGQSSIANTYEGDSVWQTTTDPNNDLGLEYDIRSTYVVDTSGLTIYDDVSNPIKSGTCTAGTTITVVDSAATWTVNAYANNYVVITGINTFGRLMTQARKIISNTSTTLTIDSSRPFFYAPTSSYTYAIGTSIRPNVVVQKFSSGNSELTGTTKISNIVNQFDIRYLDTATGTLGNYGRVAIDSSGNLTFRMGDNNPNKTVKFYANGQIGMNNDGVGEVTWSGCYGPPEGVITANPGSICSDTLNGHFYLKQSGTGNTGWVLK